MQRVDATLDVLRGDLAMGVDANDDLATGDLENSIQARGLATTGIVDHAARDPSDTISRVRSVDPPSATITSTMDR